MFLPFFSHIILEGDGGGIGAEIIEPTMDTSAAYSIMKATVRVMLLATACSSLAPIYNKTIKTSASSQLYITM